MNNQDIVNKYFLTLDPNSDFTISDFDNYINSGYSVVNDDFKLQISCLNKSENENPTYATDEAAGFDLRSNINITLGPNEFKVVGTGLYFDLPKGYEMQIRPRSGLAAKFGVTVLNSPGTIDSDYIGEIGVILINHGKSNFEIIKGDRIAQAVIASVISKSIVNFNFVDNINKDTNRSSDGFGSTGVK